MPEGAYAKTIWIIIVWSLISVVRAEDPVVFVDENLKNAVEEELWVDDPTPSDMLELESLILSSQPVADLTGLEYATQLRYLTLVKNQLADITPLANLQALRTVYVNNNLVSDLSPLSGLTGIQLLNIHENLIEDISPLSGLVNLTYLNIHDNQIVDISALASMTKLESLNFQRNDVVDISALVLLTQLNKLSASFNEIVDIAVLAQMVELTDLNLSYNPLEDLSVLAGLTCLKILDLDNCEIKNLTPLCNLQQLDELQLRRNPLNVRAYETDLQTIVTNNPGISLYYGANDREPNNLRSCEDSGGEGVSLCWDSVANGPSFTSYYCVYRAADSEATPVALSGWQTETNYEDNEIESGQCYTYWVQCAISDEGDDAGDMSQPWGVVIPSEPCLTLSSTNWGRVTVPGEGIYPYNQATTVLLKAVPEDPCLYFFSGWTGTAVDADKVDDVTSAETTVWVDGDYTLVAHFGTSLQCALAMQSDGPGSTHGAGTYTWGSSVAIEAIPDAHYHFVNWTVTGDLVVEDAGLADTRVTIYGDGVVTAHFEIDSQRLKVSSGLGGQVVKPGEGTFTYDYGSSVVLKAQPDAGYCFSHWSGNLYASLSPITLTLTSNYNVTANFNPLYRLEVGSTAGGVLVYPEQGVGEYEPGSRVPIEVHMSDPNYFVFKGWSGTAVEAGSVADANALATTVLMEGDARLVACFESQLDVIHVDDDACDDPTPFDTAGSDPRENGTEEHPFDCIQEAIEVARMGAVIVVHSGVYQETLDLSHQVVHLRGYDPNEPNAPMSYPVIDANGLGPVLLCHDQNVTVSVTGFALVRGTSALSCSNADLTLSHCLLAGHQVQDANLGVIDCVDSNVAMIQCTVCENRGTGFALSNSHLSVYNSILWDMALDDVILDEASDLWMFHTDCSFAWEGDEVFSVDPLFASAGWWEQGDEGQWTWQSGDYHLQSSFGRWNSVTGQWDVDEQTSPCIGAGDMGIWQEQGWSPEDNALNCGVYGGTSMASKEQE